MAVSFGTDGIRGVADVDLIPSVVRALGHAAASVLGGERWLVGRDTRTSGPRIVADLVDGLASHGAEVVDAGVLPTPAVAYLSQREDCPAAVVSASHNPWTDNGIKLLARGGHKLDDEVEAAIERAMVDTRSHPAAASHHPDPMSPYEGHLISSLDGRRLDGLRIALDCANGAASAVAPSVYRQVGARVDVLFAEPDGTNINSGCGSTHPAALQAAVVEHGADAGLAFDGDADRVLAVDHAGTLVDGDEIMAICALDRHRRGVLEHDALVVTVMSNLGLRLGLARHGVEVVETQVGDRYVLAALEERGLSLGGEQSGHIVFPDLATTGDGLLTGLQLLDVVARTGQGLSDLAAEAMQRLPQVLRNVRVQHARTIADDPVVRDAVAAVESKLGSTGRVLLRPSGTEPLVRVMVEAPSQIEAEEAADHLAAAVQAASDRR